MSLRVFHGDANVSIDAFSFRLSCARAAELVTSVQGHYITLANGRLAVQLYRKRAEREEQREALAALIEPGRILRMPPLELPGLRFRLAAG